MSTTTTMIDSPTHGRFVFDAVFKTDHNASAIVTQHPVQTGAAVSDHAYMEPDEISIEIGMSDAALSASGSGHSVNAYAQLRAIMDERLPVTLITRLRTYDNMVITSITTTDDYTTMNALRATIFFQRVRIVRVATIKIQQTVSASKSPQASTSGSSSPNQSTPQQPSGTKTRQSVLSKFVTAAKSTTTKAASPVSPPTKAKAQAVCLS